jgi:hypothetical protein
MLPTKALPHCCCTANALLPGFCLGSWRLFPDEAVLLASCLMYFLCIAFALPSFAGFRLGSLSNSWRGLRQRRCRRIQKHSLNLHCSVEILTTKTAAHCGCTVSFRPRCLPCFLEATPSKGCTACLMSHVLPLYHVCTAILCRFLPWFLEAIPSEGCAKGGAGAYNNAIQKDALDPTGARLLRICCCVKTVSQHAACQTM